jgi:hypothetical protein
MKQVRKHLSVANVVSLMALFVALSGVTYAATAAKNSVKAKSIAKGAVTTPKLKNNAVTTAKLRNGAVNGVKIREQAVTTNKLAPGSVRSGNLGGGVVTTPKIKNAAVDASKLAGNAVATGKIADGAVTSAKVAPNFLAQLVKDVSYATKASESNDTEDRKTATAECPAGKQVIGGGATIVGLDADNVVLRESAPVADAAGQRTAWRASAWELQEEASAWSVEAYAICATL